MGANKQEYNKTISDRLEEDHDKSYLGQKYQNAGKKMGPLGTIGSMFAPMAGSMVGSALQKNGNLDWGEYATMGGSAIGALAAPIMYRGMQKQATKDIQDLNSRNTDIRNGGKISGVQATDSMLNAGKSIKSAAMGGMAASYGLGALTGNAMDPASIGLMMKGSTALSNPGSAAFLAANQLSGANYLGGAANVHMAALPGAAVSGIGSAASSMGFEGTGKALGGIGDSLGDMTGMGGTGIGMLAYMLASAGGNKLTKSIKGMAQAKDTKKYNYRVSDLGRAASSERDVSKYDTMQTVSAQINLLTVTGQLSPYESLALGYFQSIDKHALHLNAIYDILNNQEKEKNDTNEDVFATHNSISDLLNEGVFDFSTKDSYVDSKEKGYLERTGDRAVGIYDDMNEWFQNTSTDVTAAFDIINPIKALTGGLLGNSATKDIQALYGLDEDSKRENAISKTANDMNLPSNLIQLAEMDISQVMKLSDNIEGKQLAIQSFSASILQSILKLKLDERKTEDGKGFFNRTQKNFDNQGSDSWFEKLKDKSTSIIGEIPILGMAAAYTAAKKGQRLRRESNEENSGLNMVESMALSNSKNVKQDNFMNFQFPNLFMENLSLDEERNQLLKQMIILWDGDVSKIEKKSYGVYDTLTGTIGSEIDLQQSFKDKFDEDSSSIYAQYKNAMEKDPKNKEGYEEERSKEIEKLKKQLADQYKQSSGTANLGSVGDSQEDEEDKKYKSKMLEAFEKIADMKDKENKPKSNLIDQTKEGIKKGGLKIGGLIKGAIGGMLNMLTGGAFSMLGTKKLIKYSLGSVLSLGWNFARKNKKTSALFAAAGIAYLAYENSDMVKNGIDKITSYFGGVETNEKGEKKLSTRQKVGQIMGMVGETMMLVMPTPVGKLIGAVLTLAGYGLAADWKKIMQDLFIAHPDLGKLIGAVIPEETLKGWGINQKDIAERKHKKLVKYYDEQKTKIFYEANKDFKDQNIKELSNKIELIKDEKEKERLKSLLSKLDFKKDGKIDQEDLKVGGEKYLKAQYELKNEIKSYTESLNHHFTNSLIISKGKIEAINASREEMMKQTQILKSLEAQSQSAKFNLTAISKEEALAHPSVLSRSFFSDI